MSATNAPSPGHVEGSNVAPPKRRGWRWWNRNVHDDVKHLTTINYSVKEREKQILKLVDDNGFNAKVFLVAASGFLASSYSLFATNVVIPAVAFVSPFCDRLRGTRPDELIDLLTLAGAILGMLVMGHCADRAGRKKLYGLELAILIVAAMGVVQASEGYTYVDQDERRQYAMDIYAWLAWWRSVLGFGIGAEYPLSAIIAAEWASTSSRGTTLAAVKSMQSIARLLAVGVGLGALRSNAARNNLSFPSTEDSSLVIDTDKTKLVIDQVWRTVVAIAIVPAAVAVAARLTIPETPRYYVDIMKDLRTAVKTALRVYTTRRVVHQSDSEGEGGPVPARQNSDQSEHWYRGAWEYLKRDKYRMLRRLAVISALWAIMDVGLYGHALDSPGVLGTLWDGAASHSGTSTLDGGGDRANTTAKVCAENTAPYMYAALETNAVRSLYAVSIPSVLGSFAAILAVNRFRRRLVLVCTFLTLACLFSVAGSVLLATKGESLSGRRGTLAVYGVVQFVYNLGPNTLIFILAAEIFPTVYRGTFYGIAAACGKLGAVVVRAIVAETGNYVVALGARLLVFVPLMLAAAGLAWCLPEVQRVPVPMSAETGIGAVVVAEDDASSSSSGEEDGVSPRTGGDEEAGQAAPMERTRRSGCCMGGISGFFERLENLPLEEIAPNPAFIERSKGGVVEGQEAPAMSGGIKTQ